MQARRKSLEHILAASGQRSGLTGSIAPDTWDARLANQYQSENQFAASLDFGAKYQAFISFMGKPTSYKQPKLVA